MFTKDDTRSVFLSAGASSHGSRGASCGKSICVPGVNYKKPSEQEQQQHINKISNQEDENTSSEDIAVVEKDENSLFPLLRYYLHRVAEMQELAISSGEKDQFTLVEEVEKAIETAYADARKKWRDHSHAIFPEDMIYAWIDLFRCFCFS